MAKIFLSLKTVLGIFLILLGIAGLILPVLPGWWFIPIGVQILGFRIVVKSTKKKKSIQLKRQNVKTLKKKK